MEINWIIRGENGVDQPAFLISLFLFFLGIIAVNLTLWRQGVCLYQLLTADVSPFILLHIYTLKIHVNAWVCMHLNLFYPSSFRADTDPDPAGLCITHRIRRFANDFVWEKKCESRPGFVVFCNLVRVTSICMSLHVLRYE